MGQGNRRGAMNAEKRAELFFLCGHRVSAVPWSSREACAEGMICRYNTEMDPARHRGGRSALLQRRGRGGFRGGHRGGFRGSLAELLGGAAKLFRVKPPGAVIAPCALDRPGPRRRSVAQVSKPAVSPTSKSAGAPSMPARPICPAPAGLETGDTAGLETCATAKTGGQENHSQKCLSFKALQDNQTESNQIKPLRLIRLIRPVNQRPERQEKQSQKCFGSKLIEPKSAQINPKPNPTKSDQ